VITATLPAEDDFDAWRDRARGLIRTGAEASQIIWQVGENRTDLFSGSNVVTTDNLPIGVPRGFVDLARSAICHRDPERFALLYQLLCDLKCNRKRIEDAADPLIRRLTLMSKEVRRDIHKMRAFVRFRRIETETGEHFIAWFEPDHHIVRTNAAFFVRRFASMRWSILTPEVCVHWDGSTVCEAPGARKEDAPCDDAVEEQWRTYYGSIFNPARLKVKAMLSEMPKKYWHNMPETVLIHDLIKSARAREEAMISDGAHAASEA
jgi:uracil-DNA glycosylase